MFLSSTGKINQGYKEQSESTMSLHSEGHAILEPFPCYLSLYSFHWLYSTISLVSLLLLLCCFSSAALFCFACLSIIHPCTILVDTSLCPPQFVSISKEELCAVFYCPRSLHVTHKLNRCLSIVLFLSDVGTHLHSKSSHLSCASLPMVLSSSV